MEEVMQILAALLLVIVYLVYLRQIARGESTPNPGTWIIWFIVMAINTLTYLKIVNNNYFKTAIVFVALLSMTVIMVYSLIRGKFVKLTAVDLILLSLSLIIGIFWQLTNDAKIANLFMQLVILISYLPTVVGLIQDRLKEKSSAWLLAASAYTIQAISLLVNYDGNIYQLFFPVVNGIIGNGIIPVILVCKKKT